MKKLAVLLLLVCTLALIGYALPYLLPKDDASQRLTLYGNIDVRLVSLAFEVDGRIAEMPMAEGSGVDAGQVVATLDKRRLTLARDTARAQLDARQAELDKLIAGSRKEEIAQLRADLQAAQIQADNAQRNAARNKNLAERKVASPQEYDDSHTEAEAATARAAAAQAALDLALAGTRKEDIAQARAQLAALKADYELAEVNLADATLRSPARGVVQNRILEPGDMASAARPVYTIALTQPMWARVYLAEADLGRVREGMSAQVSSDSFPGKTYTGWVGYIAPSAEFTPKTVQTTALRADLVYQARIFVCNPAGELRQGMPVTVNIDLTGAPVTDPGCADVRAALPPATTDDASAPQAQLPVGQP